MIDGGISSRIVLPVMRFVLLLSFVGTIYPIYAQADVQQDTVRELQEVVIQAYQYNRPLFETPAPVGVLSSTELYRFNESTLVPSFNTVPGVRLEERSPGSYRVSIRGSTLRSPFGVRNVKVYWNQIPLTDPGGNTYLNQLDPGMTGSIEILKGPGSSLYGAGTGGVLLLKSREITKGHYLKAGLQLGSYGSELAQLSYEEASEQSSHQVQVLHQQSDGYREQTRMSRDVVNSVFRFDLDDAQVLETYIFYSDLFYQTPGGLTLTEYQANPRQARPATATLPGAVAQDARVHLQSFFMGVSHEYAFSRKLHNRTSAYGNLVNFKNAAIRNYDHRNEQSYGARSVTTFNHVIGKAIFTAIGGGEFQAGFLPTKSYQNLGGKEGALLADDETNVLIYSLFGQGEMRWNKFSTTVGLSLNQQKITYRLLSDPNSDQEKIRYDPQLMPRVAAMWKARPTLAVMASISRGFSPPTLAEINASNGVFNQDLLPENGINYELGFRIKGFNKRLHVDVSTYIFRLNETIVIRREEDGAEYFVNAGNTNQRGLEAQIIYSDELPKEAFFSKFNLWISYAYNHYRFGDYRKDQDDFSGNELTGTPPHILSGGIDLSTRAGVYLRATCLFTDKLPLNDANTVYADSYLLPGARLGFIHKRFEFYTGVENMLDESYSLGNDLNAAGGRYYNAAPGRNFYGGLKINLAF